MKLEEDCGAWGGNKVRKLEYILAAARASGVGSFSAWGVGTSNWTSALALHGVRQGFPVRLYLWGDPPEDYRRLYDAVGAEVISIGQMKLSVGLAYGLIRPRRSDELVLPPGGSSPEGDAGSIHAGEEIADAVSAGQMPRPRAVFVPLGTCGTSAGLAAGMAARGLDVPVVAAKVAALPYGNVPLARRRAKRLLGDGSTPPIIEDKRFFAPGYGLPNDASMEAQELARLDGFELDGTYAAKAFASLIAHARSGRAGPYLFVLTSPGPPPIDPLAA
ncbi:MAG: D-cysteine desulfhydrase [Actinomycetota bacterium]|jgi:D-cysteine desulfhydrase|nr:D-cysteine desulfhydrase [Actinomycetota bacterium]